MLFAECDAWPDRFPNVFQSGLRAVQAVFPPEKPIPGNVEEIGVGSGRSAQAHRISRGVESAEDLATLARRR